jgi:DNA polymerase-3 subunit gamma/tau
VAPLRAPAPPALTLPATPPVVAAASPEVPAANAEDFAPHLQLVPPGASAPAARHETAPAQVPAPPVPTPTHAFGDRWAGLVQRLCEQGAVTALVRELALQSGLRDVDAQSAPSRWQLVVERETLRAPALRDKLAAALTAELGQPVALELEAGVPEDTPARREAAERQRRQAAAEETIRNDPVVRELMTQFKTARIVPGSVKPI